ncbi:MAG: tetratricopeptide repeat protein [Pyrinomonadaceae bacterium]|nr:tetratricopeptide repeat protein [Pyrinomonadaceae bacterium]
MKQGQPKKPSVLKIEPGRDQSGSRLVSLNEVLTERRALFLIVTSTVLVYANSLNGAFVFDDTKQIVGNPALRTWGNILRAFTSDVWSFQRGTLTADIPPPYYRPLFTAYLTLNYQLFGLWEPGWHLMSLFVHAAASVAVYFLLRRLSGDHLIATLAALIFGLHPAHVESVSWISGIPDPLSALFYIPSLLWYVRYREEGGRKWLAASLVAYGLTALCKETPLALPLVLCVWELARPQIKQGLASRLKGIALLMVPYAVVATAYLALRFSVLGRISWKHPFMASVPDSAIWMTVPYVFVSYVQHLIAPFYLSLIYGTSFITKASDPRFFVSVGFLLALGYLLWTYRNKLNAQMWTALALIVAPLLPVLNLKIFHYEYIIQDRYLYLPSIGFCYLIAILILRLARKRAPLAAAVSVALLLAFGASTILQNRVWNSSVGLWQRAVYYSPTSWSTHYNLGLAYIGVKQHQAAQTELLEARRLNPKQATIYNNLALAQAGLGDVDGAIANLKAALALDPDSIEAHNNLGAFLYDKGDYSGARREFLTVIHRDPASGSARFNLARTLAAMGDHAAAIREYEVLLAQEPNDVAARYELGLSYAASNRKQEAATELGRALRMDRDANRAAEMRKKFEQIQKTP